MDTLAHSAMKTAQAHEEAEADRLSDLDLALENWARRHGACALVARAFALASRAVAQGHTCLALEQISAALMSREQQQELPAALAQSPLVGAPATVRPLILEHDRLYLQRYHVYETRLAERLRELIATAPAPVACQRLLPEQGLFAHDAANPEASNWQAVAAFVALRHRFCVISGGPGTGKTYTIVRLLRLLIENALAAHYSVPLVALAAPTGKAAARMVEAVRAGLEQMQDSADFDPAVLQHMPQSAHTLHRLLGLSGAGTRPRFHADNPLPADVVIVDEASMVDLPLMAKLAAAIHGSARLILLGDRYQLASVESGSVLAEICASAGINRFSAAQQRAAGELLAEPNTAGTHALADHVVTLQTSRRFNADSIIGRLAAAVNTGAADTATELLQAGHAELAYHDGADAAAMRELMDRLVTNYAALMQAADPASALALLERQCVLAAVRNGPAGSETLNSGISERLARRFDFNPAALWYHGRPVMVTQNDYRSGLFNGDVGITLRDEHGQLRVWFMTESGPRALLPGALPAHASAYAMTIHKSQGSEFDHVTLVLPDYDVPVLTRELLYTGLTRARRRLTVHAHTAILRRTLARRISRVSGLAGRIAGAGNSAGHFGASTLQA